MKRVTSILLVLLFTLLLLVGVVLFVLLTPTGQGFMTTQVNRYLKKKLNTRVEIGHIRLQWPKDIGIENLYLEDMKGDTLLAAVRLKAGLDMWGLLKGRIAIDEVVLEGVRGNVYRRAPEKTFNYQFIVDAFASEDSPADTTASEPLDMSWNGLKIKQVHLSYYDDASGIDTDVRLPDASVGFSAFNPSFARYHPTTIALSNSAIRVSMFEPADLGLPIVEAPAPVPGDTLDLKLGTIDFRNVAVQYDDDVSGMKAALSFPKLLAGIDHVYLDGQSVAVKELELAGSETMVVFEPREPKTEPAPAESQVTAEDAPGWLFTMGNLKLVDNRVTYDDQNAKPVPKGLDYAHLQLTGLEGQLSDFVFSPDSIAGRLENFQFGDKSGFKLNRASTEFAYTATQTYLKKLILQTPNTSIGDHLELRYASQKELSEDPGKATISLNLVNSKIGFRDLLLLSPDLAATPPFDSQPNGFIQGTARISGKVNDLQIKEAVFSMPEATRMAVSGRIKGLPDPDKMQLQLAIQEIAASRSDLIVLMPKGTLPDSLELPERLVLTGSLDGSLDAMKLDARLATDQGNVSLAGDFLHMTDSLRASYNGSFAMEDVNLGKILMRPAEEMGSITLSADFSGTGLTPDRADARLNGVVKSADLMGYTYQDLTLSGEIQNGLAGFKASMDDANADLTIEGKADLNQAYPSVNVAADIRNLDLYQLKLYSDSISFAGNFLVDFSSTDPANPVGQVQGSDIAIERGTQKIPVGALGIEMNRENGQNRMVLESAFANATITGAFDYTEIGTILAAETDRYIQLTDTLVPVPEQPYSIALAASLTHHPALTAFAPELTQMERVDFTARLSNSGDTTLMLSARAPQTVYDSISVAGLTFDVAGDGKKLAYSGKIDEVLSGGFRVRNFHLDGDVADDLATGRVTVKDSVGSDQHLFGARVRREEKDFVVALDRRLLLNYVPWRADTTGYVRYGEDGVLIRDFTLFRNRSQEKLAINSVGDSGGGQPYPNGPIRITADSIAIGPLVEIFTRDPDLVSGRLDGDIRVRDYMGEAPVFRGDILIDSLKLQQVAMGNFEMHANNVRSDVIDLEMTLKGEHNDIALAGKYASGSAKPMDFTLDLSRLDAKLIEAFSFGELRQGNGHLAGDLIIKGSTESPELQGEIGFKDLSFIVSQMGSRYRFEDGSIVFNAPEMRLNKLAILDTLGQRLTIDGKVSLQNLAEIGYDLKINSDRFMVLNASRKDNDLVYGKVFAATNVSVKGRGGESVVDGTVKILKGSEATMILPDGDGVIDRGDGIVEFVKPGEESASRTESNGDGVNTGVVVDFASELSLNIETDPDAEFTIILDEMNGDNLRVRGNAQLNTGLAPNGQLYLLGSYELAEGAYELTFEILKRQFEIRKGSQLIWSGDPMQAELDITAVYSVVADPSGFSPSNTAYGKVPFNVLLKISGNLTSPKIVFDLEVDERAGSSVINKINEEQILSSFRNDPSEMNKQVFGLLLLNKFMAESANVSSEGFNAEAIARQSVSKMLSDQLNNLASDLIKGVQLDFDLNSTAGAAGARTDLNVGLTKGFMNDRVTVSVGRNFELENSGESAQSSEIFDNIAVNYKVTRDGRYVLRAYRKNQFQTVLEGFIVETGVSFIVTLDYNAVKEFFQKNTVN